MKNPNYTIVTTTSEVTCEFVDLQSASQLSGMHPEMILEVTRAHLVTISRQDHHGNPYFDDEAIYRLRQIEHLRNVQRVHMRTIRLIVQLMDRADAAERELRALRDQIR